jgi:hypothetical protein
MILTWLWKRVLERRGVVDVWTRPEDESRMISADTSDSSIAENAVNETKEIDILVLKIKTSVHLNVRWVKICGQKYS